MASCGEGVRSLEKTCFVEHRLAEVWRLLEGSGSGDATSAEDGEDVESALGDALDGGRDVDCEALSVADLGERVVQKVWRPCRWGNSSTRGDVGHFFLPCSP